ncbi:glycosyltransferase [Oceanidesulfovibrio marinus]|uniref:Spore protein YkvP/CgeB glycosyl transferase-like domain-containing protein n=1 Tax=Oceanidesulfovibrio marinus TaxID=370038 RepID=A0A6P1ZHS8_9BACT|nr:glycosyltransferase [Oceanidesulfovibrio marinus]TVM34574.1 hypothetical protein DQK91_08355 [Oceanidesulfovibrio marinus]
MTLVPQAALSVGVVAERKYFVPYRDAMARAIQTEGFEARALTNIDYANHGDLDAFLVIGPHKYRGRLKDHDRYIFAAVQTEQFPTPEAGAYTFGQERYEIFQEFAPEYDVIFEWHRNTARFLSKRYQHIVWLPYGSFDEMRYPECEPDAQAEPEYDFVFIGALEGVDGRRDALLEAIAKRWSVYPESQGVWKAKKGRALASARIALNIHFDHGATFESPRLFEYLTNGRFTLSETAADPHPFVEGRDYAAFFANQLVDKAAWWLNHPEERAAMAAQGCATAHSYPIEESARTVIRRLLVEKARRNDL